MTITNLRIEIVEYFADGHRCVGSNLLFKVDGKNRCSRVSWAATNPQIEMIRLNKILEMNQRKESCK